MPLQVSTTKPRPQLIVSQITTQGVPEMILGMCHFGPVESLPHYFHFVIGCGAQVSHFC